jgi:hypothetical protein
MKNLRVLFAASVAALSLWGVSQTSVHAAGAGAVTFTQTDHNLVQVIPDNQNPCTGVYGTLTLTMNDVFHVTTLANGTDWATGTSTGTLTFVPYDSSQPSYTGHFTQWFGQNDNLMNGNGTFTFSVHATGSDGSTLLYHEVAHFSVSATGVTVSFDRPTCG